MLAENAARVERVFIDRVHNGRGMYRVKWVQDGKPIEVAVGEWPVVTAVTAVAGGGGNDVVVDD